MNHPIIFIDGECMLCNSLVKYVIRKDSKAVFKFAALQSVSAKEILIKHGIEAVDLKTVILKENEEICSKSTAALRICKRLRGVHTLLYPFIFIPPFIRDFFYDFVAKRRYQWFGKYDECLIPSTDIRERFL